MQVQRGPSVLGGRLGSQGFSEIITQPFVLEGPQSRTRASPKALFLCVDYTVVCTGDYQISELGLIPREMKLPLPGAAHHQPFRWLLPEAALQRNVSLCWSFIPAHCW